MAKKVSEMVEELIAPFAEEFGLEVVEVEYVKKANGMNLTVFIDKVGGVFIEDCEKLHRAIDEPLDQLDPTAGQPYILNVSSLGLDRPLKSKRDFERNIGKTILVKLFANQDGKKVFEGELVSFGDNTLTIDCEKQHITFEISKTALIEPKIVF